MERFPALKLLDELTMEKVRVEAKKIISKNYFNDSTFRAHFGVSATVASISCILLGKMSNVPTGLETRHFLWGLSFLKFYSTEEIHATLAKTSRNSFRKWCWIVVKLLSEMKAVRDCLCIIFFISKLTII